MTPSNKPRSDAPARQPSNHRRDNKNTRTRAYHKPSNPGSSPVVRKTKPAGQRPASTRPHRAGSRHSASNSNPGRGRPKRTHGRSNHRARPITRQSQSPQAHYSVPALAPGDLRIVPVCGVEWVGTNMTFLEYQDEIIVIDAGFGFGDPDTPGVDYTLPNTTYLRDNRDKIKALIITHGHLDHVGGIPYVIEDLGFPTIYTREFGAMFIKKKLEEFPELQKKVSVEIIESHMGYVPVSPNLKFKFFGLTHSIPDSTGVVIQTPLGGIVSTGDVRVESDNGVVYDKEYEQYEFFKHENILLLTMDSTGIEKPGWSISEDIVATNIDRIMAEAKGRLFVAAFSSQVERIIQIMQSAEKHQKYVAFEGRSIKSNMAIAEHLELTSFKHVISVKEIDQYPPHKVVVILTGAQGEEFAALNRISNETHRDLRLRKDDTIVLSSSIVPGNHFDVTQLKNRLYNGSYNIVTYTDNQVHASGHGTREELLWIHKQIPYKFFMPVHGEPYMIRMHAKIAEEELGVPSHHIAVPRNGSIIEIRENGDKIVTLDEYIPNERIIVDGSYQGMLHQVVMDDRKRLNSHGMFVVVVSMDARSGKLKKSPDIISRGFVYLRESQKLLSGTRNLVKKVVEAYGAKNRGKIEFDDVKKLINDKVGKHLLKKTGKEPIVIPVVLSI